SIDTEKGKYKIRAKAKELNLAALGRYFAFNDYEILSGEADLDITATPGSSKDAIPVNISGNLAMRGGGAKLGPVSFRDVQAKINGKNGTLNIAEISGLVSGNEVRISGDLGSLGEGKLDLHATAPNIDLGKFSEILPALSDIGLSGRGRAAVDIFGSIKNIRAKGNVELIDGQILGEKFSNIAAGVDYADNVLRTEITGQQLFGAALRGDAMIDLGGRVPAINGSIAFTDLILEKLHIPYVHGKADGRISIAGNIERFNVRIGSNLRNARIFGAQFQSIMAQGIYDRGSFTLDSCEMVNNAARLSASGQWSSNSDVNAKFSMSNINLAEPTMMDGTYGFIDQMEGRFSARLDKAFYNDPWNRINLYLKGSMGQGSIGENPLDSFKADLGLANGVLNVRDLRVVSRSSEILASGVFGTGVKSEFKVSGNELNISSFPMLYTFLPPQMRTLSGNLEFAIQASGNIPAGKKMTPEVLGKYIKAGGMVALRGGELGGRIINRVEMMAYWRDDTLTLRNMNILTPVSSVSGGGVVRGGKEFDINLTGLIDLEDLSPFTRRYGRMSGKVNSTLTLKGNVAAPDLEARIDAENLEYEKVILDKVRGAIRLKDGALTLSDPIVVKKNQDEYKISGNVVFPHASPIDWSRPSFDLRLDLVKGHLQTLENLVYTGIYSFSETTRSAAIDPNKVIDPKNIDITMPSGEKLFDAQSKNVLEFWHGVEAQVTAIRSSLESEIFTAHSSGEVGGFITLEGNLQSYDSELKLNVRSGNYSGYSFDSLDLSGNYRDKVLTINDLSFIKGDGYLKVSKGIVDMEKGISLHVEAISLPIDFISSFTGLSQPCMGKMSMDMNVTGDIKSPKLSAIVEIEEGGIGEGLTGVKFDRVAGVFNYEAGWFVINQLDIVSGGQSGRIRGKIPIQAKGEMNISTDISGENVGLLFSFSPAMKWVGGSGKAKLTVTGTLNHPKVSGLLDLKDASIDFPSMGSKVEKLITYVMIKNNQIKIFNLQGLWTGATTGGKKNYLKMIGVVDLDPIFSADPKVDLNLQLDNTRLYVDMPEIFQGRVDLNSVSIAGPFPFVEKKNSEYPLLSGEIDIKKSTVILPKGGGGGGAAEGPPIPPLKLKVHVNVEKGTELKAGGINLVSLKADQFLYNFALVLSDSDVDISGTLREPQLIGQVALDSGKVDILNRSFEILPVSGQEQYYATDVFSVSENVAYFEGGQGMLGLMPRLNLTAKIEVKDVIALTSIPDDSKTPNTLVIISKITGQPFNEVPTKMLAIKFSVFEKKERTKLEVSQEDIQVLLLPDFMQAALGLDKTPGEKPPVDMMDTAKGAAKGYFRDSLKSMFSATVGRQVQEILGFESFSVDYNFGKDLDKLLPSQGGEDSAEPQWEVALTKRFFDKLFISGQYEQGSGKSQSVMQSNLKYVVRYEDILPHLHLQYSQIVVYENEQQKTANDYSIIWDAVRLAGSNLDLTYTYQPPNYMYVDKNNQLTLGAKYQFFSR
ncbi:MAG: translocation/assembly module TamB domain-containing protein, partial [bacterium]